MQGVGNIVKQRIQKAAAGESRGVRPMLLFPEVKLSCLLLYGICPSIFEGFATL